MTWLLLYNRIQITPLVSIVGYFISVVLTRQLHQKHLTLIDLYAVCYCFNIVSVLCVWYLLEHGLFVSFAFVLRSALIFGYISFVLQTANKKPQEENSNTATFDYVICILFDSSSHSIPCSGNCDRFWPTRCTLGGGRTTIFVHLKHPFFVSGAKNW